MLPAVAPSAVRVQSAAVHRPIAKAVRLMPPDDVDEALVQLLGQDCDEAASAGVVFLGGGGGL